MSQTPPRATPALSNRPLPLPASRAVKPRLAFASRPALAGLIAFAGLAALAGLPGPGQAETSLADQPLATRLSQPANVMLDLSVEQPTGNVQAHNDETAGTGCPGKDGVYSVCYFRPGVRAERVNAANAGNASFTPKVSMPYVGYFDPFKCYDYDETNTRFVPAGYTTGFSAAHHYSQQPATSIATCSGKWSGNFLNWATMQSLDLFRWAMTGGDRRVDTATLTVLQKARQSGQGTEKDSLPMKRIGTAFSTVPATPPSEVTPLTASTLYIKGNGLNTTMRVSTSSSMSPATDHEVSVEVCNPAYPETATKCTPYGTSLKPTGLIQENADQARFGVFAYLLDDDGLRDGGIMRARMKFVGPKRPTLLASGAAANSAAEWRETDGTYVLNPDPTDAASTSTLAGTTINQSGVIQYLNRFGRNSRYKLKDPLAEMMYESLRYFKNIGPTPEYANLSLTSGTGATKADGFPIITNWDDPLAPPAGFESATEWCPRNFIIVLADSYVNLDKRLPGNTSTTGEGGAQPSNPDTSLNVVTLLNEIIATETANEGVTLLNHSGGTLTAGVATKANGSAYPASIAYYANTRDIRPDGAAIQTRGKQTISTFFIDVRENGSWGSGVARTDVRRRNQLWLGAKYGGFTDVNGNGRLDIGDVTADLNGDGVIDIRDAWDTNGDNLPDRYFEAADADSMVAGLTATFAAINAEIASNAAATLATPKTELQAGNAIYQVTYDPRNWTGDMVATRYNGYDATSGRIDSTRVWSAAEKLDPVDWSARRIVTSRRDSATADWGGAMAFRWSDLTDWQKARLGNNQSVLEYLRGRTDLPTMRQRLRVQGNSQMLIPSKLGDIVDSAPRLVTKPVATLSDRFNAGYSTFVETWKDRVPMIYVGANDGMLHAFDARIDDAGGGTEAFAYAPSLLFHTEPSPDGLLALTETTYAHRYYVNATPSAADVDFARTNGSTATGDWRTVLVGGLGKGGRGYYAIDITDPSAFTSESAVAGKVLWEFSHPTMGYSYGLPQIVKTKRWGWVALLTSGYNNTTANGSTGAGAGYLYVVDIKTGALLEMVSTGSGSDASPSGLAQVSAYVPDASDGTVSEVYGGDLDGRVWRFDLTSESASIPAPVLFAELTGPTNLPQVITTAPIVRSAPVSRNRYVFIGTGSMLGQPDMISTARQTFYALRDGTRIQRWTSNTGGAPAFPIKRAKMIANSDLLNPITTDASRPGGWYHDLRNGGERIVIDPQDTDLGKISWVGNAPDPANLCSGVTRSIYYLANFETGQSQLYGTPGTGETLGTRITSFDPGSAATGLGMVRAGGNLRGIVSGTDRSLTLTPNYLRLLSPRTINWREVLEPDQ